MRSILLFGLVAVAIGLPGRALAQAAPHPSLAGGWTRNADLSDAPPGGAGGDDGSEHARGNGGGAGGGHRGGGYGGGHAGGMGRGGMGRGGGQPQMNPDEMARMRDAMRTITNPPDHLVVTQTESILVLTGADGRTIRLSPDGKKIKDENTSVERKTRWDGGKLVSEINGLGPGKMTQTFSVDPDSRQLRVVVAMDGGKSGQPRTITQVYDADAR